MVKFKLPCDSRARSGAGTINHTLLTLAGFARRRTPVHGVVLIGDSEPRDRRIAKPSSGLATFPV